MLAPRRPGRAAALAPAVAAALGVIAAVVPVACSDPSAADRVADLADGHDGAAIVDADVHGADALVEVDAAPAADTAQTADTADTADAADTAATADAGDIAAQPDAGAAGDASPTPWHSELVPEGWTPAHTLSDGRFVHDFSYAGYAYGEPVPLAWPGTVVSVLDHGADPTGQSDSAAALQAAINAVGAAGGGTVSLPAGLFRLDDIVTVADPGVQIAGAPQGGTQLWPTRTEAMAYKAHVRFAGKPKTASELPLVVDATPRDTWVIVSLQGPAEPPPLAPGDDIELGHVITDDYVSDHGMTGVWGPFNGQWQTFERRTVTAVAVLEAGEPLPAELAPPAKLTLPGGVALPEAVTLPALAVALDVPVRSPLLSRDGAALRRVTGLLGQVGIRDVAVGNAIDPAQAWAQDQVDAVAFDAVKDAFALGVTSFAPPSSPTTGPNAGFHLWSGGIRVSRSKRVTVAECALQRPIHRGPGGNGYLFQIRASSEVLTRDCEARQARHGFIQNWGFGATGLVWLRCLSVEGVVQWARELPLGGIGLSEYHHSLATANLVDSCTLHDGFAAQNRGDYSSGAGHAATECVFWNNSGTGKIVSRQWGHGYVVGTSGGLGVQAALDGPNGDLLGGGEGTAPEDHVEGLGMGETLLPGSLYEHQRAVRLSASP